MNDPEVRERIFDGVVPEEATSAKRDALTAASEGLILGLQASELNSDQKQLPATGLITYADSDAAPPTKRTPKRILHFSDGILEEFSSDEEDATDASASLQLNPNAQALLNPENLTWGPYVWYQATRFGASALSACDYLGENLAHFFGITSPKYQFEINEYLRMKAQEEERAKQDVEMAGWKGDISQSLSSEGNEYKTDEQLPVSTTQPSLDRERLHLLPHV